MRTRSESVPGTVKLFERSGERRELSMDVVDELAAGRPGDLVWRPVGHLFGRNVTRLAFKRGAYLRSFVYAFAEMMSDRLSRALIARVMTGETSPQFEL